MPSLPSNYEVVGERFFDEMAELPLKHYHPEAEGAVATAHIVGGEDSAIVVHEKRIVGDYEIQPVEILNDQAGGELNAWLSKKGFGTVPVENQRYYLTKGAVFLAIKLRGIKGAAVKLKPLHITYKANKLSLPLKFSSHSGIFDVTLYVFTDRRLDNGILYASLLYSDRWGEFAAASLAAKALGLRKRVGNRKGFLTRFVGYRYNVEGRSVKDFLRDPAIDVSFK